MKYHSIIMLAMLSLAFACKNNSTNKTKEDPSATLSTFKEPDSIVAIESHKKENNKLASVASFINRDFDSINNSHFNRKNITYFQGLNGEYPFDTDLLTNPNFINRLKKLMGDAYREVEYINKNIVSIPIDVKFNFFIMTGGEAHNVGYNNYKVLYDMDKDILAVAHSNYDFDADDKIIKLFIEEENRYTEEQFFVLYNWVDGNI